MAKTRLIIIDDNFVMRTGLKAALSLENDFEVIGEGQNGLEAVELALKLRPDLMLLDFRMPLLDGIQATERILAEAPDIRILMTTWSEEPQTLLGAILAGAKGYLVHGRFSLAELTSAIRAVLDGGALITPSLVPVLLDLIKNQTASISGYSLNDLIDSDFNSSQTSPAPSLNSESFTSDPGNSNKTEQLLTKRERQILELVQQGKSNREIAEILIIEEKTVKNHINNLYSKLHLKTRREAISLNNLA